jgi:uncharacterized membrane protein
MQSEGRSPYQASRQWVLKKNCALTPGQLATWFAFLGSISAAIAIAFALQGAWMVVPFAALEISALVVAYVVYARHAADYERIEVSSGEVTIETASASKVQRWVLSAPWVRVEYRGLPRDLIRLKSGAQEYFVGRYASDPDRRRLARELRGLLAVR